MTDDLEKQLLRGVSRSFYLTLRLLPRPMRGPASLGYLLARTSDTLADSAAVPIPERLRWLDEFNRSVAGRGAAPRWPEPLLHALSDPRERLLLERSDGIIGWLRRLPEAEATLVRQVLEIIISGQKLDLQRFATAGRDQPVALPDDSALDDYAWRVAGCVGAFWTKLGFLTLGNRYSATHPMVLLEQGIAYGKGLQLVNILRDLSADLATGRCYLPVADPRDPVELLACHARWLDQAVVWVASGETYAACLRSRRLRAATVLPALIARKTLEPLRGASWQTLQTRVKVPRSVVYRTLVEALCTRPGRS